MTERTSPDHVDNLRLCEGCGNIRHVSQFVSWRKYCRTCYGAHQNRLDRMLRDGTASPEEVLRVLTQQELPRPLDPTIDHVTMTVKEDVPDLTTEDLNQRLAQPWAFDETMDLAMEDWMATHSS